MMSEMSAEVLLRLLEEEHFQRALGEFCEEKGRQHYDDLRNAARAGHTVEATVSEALLTFVEDLPKSMRSLAKQYASR